ncbi:hypothetical protein AN4429.2 [Aspergillus nidulans FGSC A4]|uniref:Uncharacterized protein n=1 Tax=Emericella nidulans (strain FGSC A4 / ATCC 38163 / CBS 112.46 / NRRL 194 / M139) TaxID=227321 RepID=Q5B4V1_EMENI|nr:hypothetical protein [Aspergillus nidulans FGSC A4]EAA60194.1 hypothetical protein AN4429.2 [Aspergillus nidulans FGSC A4]CBF77542.1 TPA: conserved hypothetical protein [Aspergillus nidulans FGSC A4]|eukprot:XP_662033.1 hypothetical protein AN4429.2 [Aspergillus nidulans FGSC A4]
MAEAATERLNRLQEADLGTARREEISTADHDSNTWLTRLDVIEASRRSNVQGTIEQQLAQANRDCLDAWTKHLDNLLDGQSHRLRLEKELRGGNTHDQQTSNRGQRALKGPTQNKSSNHNAKLQNQAVPHGTLAASVLLSSDVHSSNSSSRVYSQKISSAEEFLVEVRSVTSRRGPEQEPLIQKSKAKVSAKTTDRCGKDACRTPRSRNIVKPKEQKVTTQLTISMTPEDKVEDKFGTTNHDLGAGLVSTESPRETPPTASINTTGQAKTGEKLEPNTQESVATPMDSTPASRPQRVVGTLVDLDSPVESENAAAMSPALQELEGLDFTQSLEPEISQSSTLAVAKRRLDLGRFSHPKQQMTSDLDVLEATTDTEDEESVDEYRREIDIVCQLLQQTHLSKTFLCKLTECKDVLEARLRQRCEPKLGKPQNQQSLTLPDPESEKAEIAAPVKACKAAAPGPKEPHFVRPVVNDNTPTPGDITPTPRVSIPSSPSRLNVSVLQFTPNSCSEQKSFPDATTKSISLEPIADEVVSATQSKSASSEDTVVLATADTPSPESQPSCISIFKSVAQEISGTGHLLGDHLLPGSEYRQPEQSHLYGNHLLPGQRVTPTTIYKQTVPETTEFALAKAAISKPAPAVLSFSPPNKQGQTATKSLPANFTIPLPSEPIRIVDPNILVSSIAKSSSGASAALGAPSSTTLTTAQKTPSMMKSIYAPQLKEAPPSIMDVKKGSPASQ